MSSRTIPWLLVVPYGLTGLGAGLFIPYLNLFFAQQLGARTEQIGFIFAIEAIATGMAGFTAPYLGRKFGNVQGVAYARLAAIPFLFLMAHIPFLWVVAAAAWLRNVLANSASPLLTNFAMDLAPYETRGTLNSFLNISYQAGWALSAGLGGWIIQHFHYVISFYFAALLFAAANVFLYVTFQPWDR